MSKKFLSAMMAFAMLFATSCQNDIETFGTSADGAAEVTFSIETPELATRAFSDGLSAKDLQYAVYDANNVWLGDLDGTATFNNLTTTVNLTLTTGNTYTVLFWADNENAPYTFDSETQTVTIDYDAAKTMCNDENRDAFFASHTFTVNGKQTETVKLYRPFSQLNIGTCDYAASEKAGYLPTQSAVKVKNVYTTLNLLNGEVGTPTEVFYNYTDIPRSETFPVEGYEYLSMNYLLVDTEKELVEVEFSYKDPTAVLGEEEKTRIVGSVPVQRNFRTNIYGKLLTSEVDINVEIVPAYNKPDELFPDSPKDALYLAAATGGEYTMTEDIELTSTLYVQSSLIINLNGKTLKNKVENASTDVINVLGNATLTINGEGTVEAVSGNDGYAVIAKNNSTVIINGGTYKAGTDENNEANAVIYARDNAKVFVNGGYYPNDCNSAYVLNKRDADRATTTIEVKGGTFKGFDPANNTAENAGTNFVAEGYISYEKEGYYIVVNGAVVTNADEFKAAAANENLQYIIFANNIDFGTSTASVTTNKVIEGNGFKLIAGGKTTKNYGLGVSGANVTINDLVMNGGGGIYSTNGANVVVNNITLKSNYSASGRNLFYVNGATLTVNSGEFEVLRTGCRYFGIDTNAQVYVKGGTFEDMMAKDTPVYIASGASLEISGGKFQVGVANYKFDPTAYLAAGYKAERVGNYMEVSAE